MKQKKIQELREEIARLKEEVRQLHNGEEPDDLETNRSIRHLLDDVTEVAIITMDTSGILQSFNPGAEKMSGYLAEEVIGKDPIPIFHPPGYLVSFYQEIRKPPKEKRFEDLMHHVVEKGWARRLLPYRRKDGSRFIGMLTLSVIRDRKGTPKGFLGIILDSTREFRIEKKLKRSEETYRALARNFPNGAVVMFDQEMRYFLADGTGLKDAGLSKEMLEGKTIYEVFPPETVAVIEADYRSALQGNHTVSEVPFAGHIYRTYTLPATTEAGEIFGGMVVTQDISSLKDAQARLEELNLNLGQLVNQRTRKLKEMMEEARDFAYIVSHDLRVPLVNIQGFNGELEHAIKELSDMGAEMIEELPPEKQKHCRYLLYEDIPESLNFIRLSVSRMDKLIYSILQLHRLGRKNMEARPVETGSVVEEVINSLHHMMDKHKVEVEMGELPVVIADPIGLSQVFSNLLHNAVLYLLPDRPGKIRIWGEKEENRTLFHIRDNGRGIAEKDLSRIFNLFARAVQKDVEGEGMGLAYVRSIVRKHGGEIWCKSVPGEGSTFSFTIADEIKEEDLLA
jgi:PAS domain S-box-containing protein